jgi:hypothetical protein
MIAVTQVVQTDDAFAFVLRQDIIIVGYSWLCKTDNKMALDILRLYQFTAYRALDTERENTDGHGGAD